MVYCFPPLAVGMGREGGEERKRKKKKKTPAKSTVLQCQVYGAVGIGMYGIIRYFCMSGYTLLLSARVGVALSVTRCMMVSIHPSRHVGM